MIKSLVIAVAALVSVALVGCESTPKTTSEKRSVQDEGQAALREMQTKDSSLNDFLSRAYGYAIFPSVGKGGAIVGAAAGEGAVYEHGRLVGYAALNQGSIGAQLGGQTFSELLVFENENALRRLQSGNFDLGASASAVALKAGASGAARFENGVAVFTMPKGGLMVDLSVNGQKFTYRPATDSDRQRIDSNRERIEVEHD